jgi:type I restriction enzyme S subunit
MMTTRLQEIATRDGLVGGPFGSNLVAGDYASDGIPVIRGGNLSHGKYLGGIHVFVTSEKFHTDLIKNSAAPGDLVFTQRGTLGQVAIVPNDQHENYVVSQSQMRLRIDARRFDCAFVYYACSSPDFLRQIDDRAIRTGVPHINLGILGELSIPHPPLALQERVGESLGALDDKIAANRRAAALAQELCSALFDRAHTDCTESVPLADLAGSGELVLGDGYRTRKDQLASDMGYAIVRAADVVDGQVRFNGADAVDESLTKAMGQKIAQAGDVIVTTKGTIGRVARIPTAPPKAVYSPQLCFFRVVDHTRVTPAYLRTWLSSEEFARQALNVQHKTDMAPYISLGDLRSFRISIPGEGQRRRLYRELDELQKLEAAWQLESYTLAELRDTLLPHLMSGRLTVRAAESIVSDVV